MDAVEQWLIDRASDLDSDGKVSGRRFDTCMSLANEWREKPGVTTVTYEADDPLAEFLDKIDGPVMIGLDPVIYPACTTCSWAWKLTRRRGVWSWSPDCSHKTASCKLVHA